MEKEEPGESRKRIESFEIKSEIIKFFQWEIEFIRNELNNWDNPDYFTRAMPEEVQKRKRKKIEKFKKYISYLESV